MPVVGYGAGEDLDPKFFGIIRVKFGESSSDAS